MPDGSGGTPCETFLKSLLGVWETEKDDAAGKFPTIPSFSYGQSATFFRVKQQTKAFFIHTDNSTWPKGQEGKRGMHYDAGYMKCASPKKVLWALSHNFGGTEMLEGVVDNSGASASFKSTSLGGMSEVTATERKLTVYKGQLQDDFAMATKSVPNMTDHLKSFMVKRGDMM